MSQARVGTVILVLQVAHTHSLVSGPSATNSMAPPHIGQKGTTRQGDGGPISMRRTIPEPAHDYEGPSSFSRHLRRAIANALSGTEMPV